MSFRLTSGRTPIGVDVGERHLSAVQLRRSGRRMRVEAATALRRADAMIPFDVSDVRQLVGALGRQGFSGRRVVLAMPPESLIVDVLEIAGRTDGDDLAERVCTEFARAHRWEPESFELAFWPLPKKARLADASSVMAVACPHERANVLLDAFEEVGLSVVGLETHAHALLRATAPIVEQERGNAVLMHVGWSASHLVALADSTIVYERALNESGLNRVQMAMMNKLGLDEDVTEYLLSEIGLEPERAESGTESRLLSEIQQQLTSHLSKIVTELRRSLTYLAQEFQDHPIRKLYVVGEGGGVPGLSARLGSLLSMQVQPLAPLDVSECLPTATAACGRPMLMTALGLALHQER